MMLSSLFGKMVCKEHYFLFKRLEREYNCKVILGKPKVAFRESLVGPVK